MKTRESESQESPTRITVALARAKKILNKTEWNVCAVQRPEHKAGDGVVPAVRDHARAKASAMDRQQAEERAKRSNHQHSRDSFVAMRGAEERGRGEHAYPQLSGRAAELLLKISAEDKFFADSGGNAERDPERGLGEARWRELADLFLGALEMKEAQQDRERGKYDERENPEERRCAHVDEEFLQAAPPHAEQNPQRGLPQTNSPVSNSRKRPFPRQGDGIVSQVVRGHRTLCGMQ